MPRALAPVFAVAPLQQLPPLVRKLRKLRKYRSGLRRQWNTARCERIVATSLQVRQPGKGVDDLGIDLVGIVGRLAEWRLGRPRIEETAIDTVGVAGKTARQQIRLEPTNDTDEEVRQYHRGTAEAFHGKAVTVPGLEPERAIRTAGVAFQIHEQPGKLVGHIDNAARSRLKQ